MENMKVLSFGAICPKCQAVVGMSDHFSIIPQRGVIICPEWPEGTLGVSDCPIHEKPFLVRMPDKLRNSIEACLITAGIENVNQVMKALFG